MTKAAGPQRPSVHLKTDLHLMLQAYAIFAYTKSKLLSNAHYLQHFDDSAAGGGTVFCSSKTSDSPCV